MAKKIIGARSDENGKTTHVQLSGNKGMTPVQSAVRMAEKGQITNAHAVHAKGLDPYVRTNPNGRARDNIDYLSGDRK